MVIDMRTDHVTRPVEGMLAAMAAAETVTTPNRRSEGRRRCGQRNNADPTVGRLVQCGFLTCHARQ